MINYIGIWTMVKREIKRTIKIVNQVIWPPIISTLLYAFVFGISLGTQIPEINGVPYLAFLIPGLIMMSIIEHSYGEGTASLFIAKFTNSLHELLIAPLSYAEIIIGYVLGSVLRGLFIGNIIFIVAHFVLNATIIHYEFYILFMILVSLLFSSIGIAVGLWAETFDDTAILSTFFITPLVFFGGVFHSITFLPETLQKISLANPLFYMIDGFRYSMTGLSTVNVWYSVGIVFACAAAAFWLTLWLFSKGYKIKV